MKPATWTQDTGFPCLEPTVVHDSIVCTNFNLFYFILIYESLQNFRHMHIELQIQ
jgi:hypothetical protein